MERLEGFKKAGSIHKKVRLEAMGMIKPGMKLLDIAEFIESKIREMNGGLAFPVNTSLNDIAAHYVAQGLDEKTVEEGDLLKVDFGVEVEGYIADGAFTYCSEKCELAEVAEKSIMKAVKVIRPGVEIGEVSQAIESSIKDAGLGVIVNLTGHGVDQYEFHAPPTIPNTATGSKHVLEDGMVIALEPFVLEKNSQVRDSAPIEIYRFLTEKPVRLPDARKVLALIKEQYGPFPFAKRWLFKEFSPVKASISINQLESVGALESYAPLKEVSGQKIAQAEHTIIVADNPVVTTL